MKNNKRRLTLDQFINEMDSLYELNVWAEAKCIRMSQDGYVDLLYLLDEWKHDSGGKVQAVIDNIPRVLFNGLPIFIDLEGHRVSKDTLFLVCDRELNTIYCVNRFIEKQHSVA